jgi:hypothetical protein
MTLIDKGKHIAFTFFKKEFLGRIEELKKEEKFLASLGPFFEFGEHLPMGEQEIFKAGDNAAWKDVIGLNTAVGSGQKSWMDMIRGKL